MMIEGPSNESRAWNAEEIERLGDLIFNGKDISQIAQILSRPYGAVKCKANTLGMLSKPGSGHRHIVAQRSALEPS